MLRSILVAGLLTGLAAYGAPVREGNAAHERTPVLLELFTSEGCSSCPPADRLLESLDEAQPFPDVDLIVLSEHVDYWNSGGWPDPFTSKFATPRQDRYAQQLNVESVYTPQRVIDGHLEGVGSNAEDIKRDIEKAAQAKKVPVTLTNVSRNGSSLKFHASAGETNGGAEKATLYVALAGNKMHSEVRHGENAGRSLTHVAVAYTLVPIGPVKSEEGLSKDLTLKIPAALSNSEIRVVAFLQVDRTQQIVGVTQVKL